MTTFVDFVPSTVAPFSFQATLDGQVYNVIVTWSLFGRRYYVNVVALDGTIVVSLALVGSPTGVAIQELSWLRGKAIAVTAVPHGYDVGRIVGLTVSGAAPDAFNGLVDAVITGPDSFSWALSTDPGAATAFGTVSYNLSLTAGYFDSTLVYRQAANQFEVSP
jgi:hypothetical protein